MAKKTKAQRKSESRARKNLKLNKAKTLVDKPAANDQTSDSCQNKDSLPILTGTSLRDAPTTTGETKENNADKKTRYSEYVMWPLVTVRRRVVILWRRIVSPVVAFLDKNSGAVTALATVVIAVLTWNYVKISKRQWQVAQDTLLVSQRAYVTIGRKDGVIADFVIPKDAKQDAEIIIYFQNSGHLPAKLAWGTFAAFKGQGSIRNSGIKYTHPYKGLVFKTRDRKTGEWTESEEGSIIAGDSILVSTVGTISQADLAALPNNDPGLLIMGNYDYCDELGDFMRRNFALRYRGDAPTSSLSFDLAMDRGTPANVPESTATTEYLSPCETITERQKNQGSATK